MRIDEINREDVDRVIEIDRSLLDEQASLYFLDMSGLAREGEKFDRMRERGFEIRERILDRIKVRAILSRVSPSGFSGNILSVGDVQLICDTFEDLDLSKIKEVYLYILTAGAVELLDEPIMNQLYSEFWGTSYVDSGREYLRQVLLAEYGQRHGVCEEVSISDSFGPGYFGMEMQEMEKFFQVLAAEKIKVSLKSSSLLLPLKSCAGLYVIGDEHMQMPGIDCGACLGTLTGCQFCNASVRKLKKCNRMGANF